jgi:hypothetical protein
VRFDRIVLIERWLGPALEILRAMLAQAAAEAASPADAVQQAQDAGGVQIVLLAPDEGDTEDDGVVGPPEPLANCQERLEAAGVRFDASRISVHRRGSIVCGAPDVVRYRGSQAAITWRGGPKMTCQVALALPRFEAIVQEEAHLHFARPVARIEHLGTYNCREMAAYPGWVSEHSYANAIDIKAFVLRGGRRVEVLGNYGDGTEPPEDAEERFLRAVARRTYDEDVFSVVLTPAFDRAHRNHFHLDWARYRVDGTGR